MAIDRDDRAARGVAAGPCVSRSQMIELAYDNDQDVSDRVVDSHVKNIRHKIGELLEAEVIQSVYGVGYLFDLK